MEHALNTYDRESAHASSKMPSHPPVIQVDSEGRDAGSEPKLVLYSYISSLAADVRVSECCGSGSSVEDANAEPASGEPVLAWALAWSRSFFVCIKVCDFFVFFSSSSSLLASRHCIDGLLRLLPPPVFSGITFIHPSFEGWHRFFLCQ